MTGVSVIIPACNAARTLGETLDSVLRQGTAVAEVIVVDDGSTDDTARLAQSFAGVRLQRQANAGPAAALNAGVAASSGEVLLMLDADDILPPRAVAAHLACLAMDAACEAAVGHMEEFICPSEDADRARRFQPRPRQPGWVAGATALRAAALRRVGPFDGQLRAGYWIDWMDRAKLAGLRFSVHEETVLCRRLHSRSLSMDPAVRQGRGLVLAARNALLRRREAAARQDAAHRNDAMKED